MYGEFNPEIKYYTFYSPGIQDVLKAGLHNGGAQTAGISRKITNRNNVNIRLRPSNNEAETNRKPRGAPGD